MVRRHGLARLNVIAPNDLTLLLNHLRLAQTLTSPSPYVEPDQSTPLDMADLKGQETTRRAIDAREALEVTMLHSVAGQLSVCRLIQ